MVFENLKQDVQKTAFLRTSVSGIRIRSAQNGDVEVLADLLLFDAEDHLGAREEHVDVGVVLVGVEHDLVEVVRVSV